MNSLPNQVMPHLLDGKDKSETLLFDQVVATFCANQGSTEIIDGLLGAFIILLCEQSTKRMVYGPLHIVRMVFPQHEILGPEA